MNAFHLINIDNTFIPQHVDTGAKYLYWTMVDGKDGAQVEAEASNEQVSSAPPSSFFAACPLRGWTITTLMMERKKRMKNKKDENGGDDKEVPETVEGDPDSPEAPKSRKRNRSECNDEVALDRESKRALDHIRRIPKLSQYRADKRGRRSSVFVNEDDHANALASHLGEM